jgi:anti-anti-sigma factor
VRYDCDVIGLNGDIDLTRVDQLDGLVETFRHSSAPHVTVDLTEVTFFGSEGVGFVFRLVQLALPREGAVTLVNASDMAVESLAVWGLHDVIHDRSQSPVRAAARGDVPGQRTAPDESSIMSSASSSEHPR